MKEKNITQEDLNKIIEQQFYGSLEKNLITNKIFKDKNDFVDQRDAYIVINKLKGDK